MKWSVFTFIYQYKDFFIQEFIEAESNLNDLIDEYQQIQNIENDDEKHD
jgi:hypothetical protein